MDMFQIILIIIIAVVFVAMILLLFVGKKSSKKITKDSNNVKNVGKAKAKADPVAVDKKEGSKEEAPKEESPKEEAPKEETPKEETPKEESKKEEIIKEDPLKAEGKVEETEKTTEEVLKEEKKEIQKEDKKEAQKEEKKETSNSTFEKTVKESESVMISAKEITLEISKKYIVGKDIKAGIYKLETLNDAKTADINLYGLDVSYNNGEKIVLANNDELIAKSPIKIKK